jgi:hypothetical protein
MKPLVIDLFCGLGGWAEGFLSEGFDVIGFDIERHDYGTGGYPGQLVLQDVLTLHGSQFKDAACIVCSPPCQEYSYMAMPFSRGKKIAAALRGNGEFPERYTGSRTIGELNALFHACFRIQHEASEAAGRHIPMVVENVWGAQPWVGKAVFNYGSFYLWGDVPALMPTTKPRAKAPGMNWSDQTKRGQDFTRCAAAGGYKREKVSNQRESDAVKHGGDCFNDPTWPGKQGGVKQAGISKARKNGKGNSSAAWFQDGASSYGSKSNSRKAASAQIAKIPFTLARHIARCLKPAPIDF